MQSSLQAFILTPSVFFTINTLLFHLIRQDESSGGFFTLTGVHFNTSLLFLYDQGVMAHSCIDSASNKSHSFF